MQKNQVYFSMREVGEGMQMNRTKQLLFSMQAIQDYTSLHLKTLMKIYLK